MGHFTSNYKDQNGRITTRVDTVKSIDSLATLITYLIFGIFILLWKIFKYIFLKKQDSKSVESTVQTETAPKKSNTKSLLIMAVLVIVIFLIIPKVTHF